MGILQNEKKISSINEHSHRRRNITNDFAKLCKNKAMKS